MCPLPHRWYRIPTRKIQYTSFTFLNKGKDYKVLGVSGTTPPVPLSPQFSSPKLLITSTLNSFILGKQHRNIINRINSSSTCYTFFFFHILYKQKWKKIIYVHNSKCSLTIFLFSVFFKLFLSYINSGDGIINTIIPPPC